MIPKDLVDSIEPSDEQRGAARSLYGLFIALIDEGFDEVQALNMVTAIVSTVSLDQ
jgi:hypothetical protein